MDTKRKDAIKKLQKEIAELEKKQKQFKENRKTVYFKGERLMEPWKAAMKVQETKFCLRILYAAYGLLRFKKFSQIESAFKPIKDYCYLNWHGDLSGRHPLYKYIYNINGVLNDYGYTMPYENVNFYGNNRKKIKIDECEEIVCLSE